jgi:hypothetical protein
VARRARRPSFSKQDRDRLIEALREARSNTVKCSAAEPFGSPRYEFCHAVVTSIDDLAEDLTGDRTLFHTKPHGG